MYELEGKIKVMFETMTFNSGFTKREFVVTTEDKYPQDIKLQCVKEKIEILDAVQVGEKVKVSFDLRGNEYKERYYVDLQAWRVEKVDGESGGSGAGDKPPVPAMIWRLTRTTTCRSDRSPAECSPGGDGAGEAVARYGIPTKFPAKGWTKQICLCNEAVL